MVPTYDLSDDSFKALFLLWSSLNSKDMASDLEHQDECVLENIVRIDLCEGPILKFMHDDAERQE